MAETEPPSLGPVSSRDQSSPSSVDDSLLREPPVNVISIQDDKEYVLTPHGAFPIENVTQDGGVLKSIVHHGQGPVVPLHATCLVHYAGRIVSNGDVFMNTRDVRERGRGEPAHIVAGRDAIRKEKGLHEIVATMRVGEICHAWVSPEYGYGDDGNFSFPSIPPRATLSYSIELVDFESPSSGECGDSSFLTYEERLEAAKRRRLEGNALYTSGRVEDALVKYESSLAYLDDDFIMQLYEFHYEKAMEEKVNVLLNVSACKLKQEQYHAVIELTSEVLSHDKSNVKSLYRRGVARRKLGQTTEALEDLEKAKAISEKASNVDTGIVREILAARKDIKDQTKVQGRLYKTMMQSAQVGPSEKEEKALGSSRQQEPKGHVFSRLQECIYLWISWCLSCLYRPFKTAMSRDMNKKRHRE